MALGGVGYAAATVNSGDVQNNSLTTKDIKNKSVKKKDLAFNDHRAGSRARPARPARPVAPGAQGDPGVPGGSGATGPQGAAGHRRCQRPWDGVQ